MKYLKLNDKCKKAIETGRCLGCQGLEDFNYTGNLNCQYNRTPSVQESLNQIWKNLGVQEKIKDI